MQNKKIQKNIEFNNWNEAKKEINAKEILSNLFFYEREVWWCSVGINVGVESNGKNENFERPVLIIKKFNSEMNSMSIYESDPTFLWGPRRPKPLIIKV